MGFQSMNDLINRMTGGSAPGAAKPNQYRSDWSKITTYALTAANRWADTSYLLGNPTSHADASGMDGNWVYKGGFQGGSNFWILGDVSWRWTSGNVITKMSNNSYYLAATIANGQTGVYCLAEFNGKLYGGTGPSGQLCEWDGFNNWVVKAPYSGTETQVYSLCVFNGKLYGGTAPNGKLLEWNGVDAWVEKAGILEAQTIIQSLIVFNDGTGDKLYGGTFPGGKLFQWDGVSAWVRVANTLGAQSQINALCVFNNKLYGGTTNAGKLFEWDSVGLVWVEKAPQFNAQADIFSLCVFNDGTGDALYGGTGANGRLYKWNGVNAWMSAAVPLTASAIYSLVVHAGKIYGGTGGGTGGLLYEWDGVGAWTLVATPSPVQSELRALRVFNGKLYCSTYTATTGGRLLEWIPTNAGTASLTATMQRPIIPGNVYRVQWTIATPAGTGSITAKLGGVLGTPRVASSGNATVVEYLTTVNSDPLEFVISNSAFTLVSLDGVSVTAVAQATFPYGSNSRIADDSGMCAMQHGGDVAPATKHLINVGVTSSQMYGELLLVDRLMTYSGISNATALPQTLLTSLALPRYSDGKGVRAYLVGNGNGLGAASGYLPQNVAISYTNTNGVPGRTMPVTVAVTPGNPPSHLCCTGTGFDLYGPFLPMAAGDLGIRSVESVQFSAANSNGECTLVLCKPLLYLPTGLVTFSYERETLNQLPSLPRIYDGACLQWLFFPWAVFSANICNIQGYLDFAWG